MPSYMTDQIHFAVETRIVSRSQRIRARLMAAQLRHLCRASFLHCWVPKKEAIHYGSRSLREPITSDCVKPVTDRCTLRSIQIELS